MSRHRCIVVNRTEDGAFFHVPGRDTPVRKADLPPGAMWEDEGSDRKGPDGKAWAVKLPDGFVWLIDRQASDGTLWTRNGEAPDLTVRPSIHVTTQKYDWAAYDRGVVPVPSTTVTCYHGYLSGGWLESTPDSPC